MTEKDHFGSDAFIAHKRTFMTVWHEENTANLRLSLEQQRHFLSIDGEGFSEIDNAWGRQGWTKVHLKYVDRGQFIEAMNSAWEHSKTKGTPLVSTQAKKRKGKSAKTDRPRVNRR